MNFKVRDLGSEVNLFGFAKGNITEAEIISTELNQLKLKVGLEEYKLQNSILQIGGEEIFLYGWIIFKDKSLKIKYALNILEKE